MADQRQEDQTYKGLVLSSNGGELPLGSSPVFHNVDIAADVIGGNRGSSKEDLEMNDASSKGC